ITPISIQTRQGSLGSYYACSSYTKINPEFGTELDFIELVQFAHELGMKVIIDWVANHTGWDHEWTVHHKEWFALDSNGNFTERNGWHDVIDLNYHNLNMQDAMINAMKYWVENCQIDGFRCDMAHLVILDFWKKARRACETNKPLFWLAECDEPQYLEVFDASYAWSWMHVTERYTKGEASLNDMRNVLHHYSQQFHDTRKMFFTSNHDENSWNGTEYEKYGKAYKAWAVFTQTWQGIPLIYSGQEMANTKRLKFFDKDEIEWMPIVPLHKFYQTLLHLRKSEAIASGETFILPTNHPDVMAFLRRKNEEVVLVILNFSGNDRIHFSVEHEWLKGTFANIFSGLTFTFAIKEQFELMGYDSIVYRKIH
ncbi:MAG: alpha-amylase family glycosyl hydrolase, partial [Chitinophagaceae bacterium]